MNVLNMVNSAPPVYHLGPQMLPPFSPIVPLENTVTLMQNVINLPTSSESIPDDTTEPETAPKRRGR
jgi:hypothetical protein